MRLLLDTHTFLWFVLNDGKLSNTARQLIEDPSNVIIISPASYWEVAIKVRQKKLELYSSYDEFVKRGIEGNDFEILHIEPRHTSQLTTLPNHHKDPFDRLIISQSIVEQLPIISIDQVFDDYGVKRLW